MFKVHYASPFAVWQNEESQLDVKTIIYSWCTPLDEIDPDSTHAPIGCQSQDIFAGTVDGLPDAVVPTDTCDVLSKGKTKNIDAININGIPKVNTDPTPIEADHLAGQDMNNISEYKPLDEPLDGVALVYSDGAPCGDNQEPASFRINMYCDETYALTEFAYGIQAHGDVCNPQVDVISYAGCSVLSISSLWEYLEQYSDYFGAAMILAGALLVLWGKKFIKPAIFFAGFLSTVVAGCLIYYAIYYDQNSQLADFWWILGGSIAAGIIVGLILSCFVKLGAAILAAWGGYCLGLIFYEGVLFHAHQEWLFWVFTIACALICFVLAFKVFDEMCILGTVALGCYSLVRGVACYAGHYYNES